MMTVKEKVTSIFGNDEELRRAKRNVFLKSLHAKHPKLFVRNKMLEMRGIGWSAIIENLCEQLDELANSQKLTDEEWPHFTQIKEKFGILRVYTNLSGFNDIATEKAHEYIKQAQQASETVCESCGSIEAKLRDGSIGGWIHTYCDVCELEYQT